MNTFVLFVLVLKIVFEKTCKVFLFRQLFQLFRKDLISAMKLADSEPLTADEYWVIGDQWKQEWERGVQVPVNPDSLPGPSVSPVSHCSYVAKTGHEFKL